VVRSVADATENFLATVELDELGEARAAIALTLATKLDACLKNDAASVAMAVAGMSKELRECLAEIVDANDSSAEEFLQGVFAPLGNPSNS
jgi:hypothetical protein